MKALKSYWAAVVPEGGAWEAASWFVSVYATAPGVLMPPVLPPLELVVVPLLELVVVPLLELVVVPLLELVVVPLLEPLLLWFLWLTLLPLLLVVPLLPAVVPLVVPLLVPLVVPLLVPLVVPLVVPALLEVLPLSLALPLLLPAPPHDASASAADKATRPPINRRWFFIAFPLWYVVLDNVNWLLALRRHHVIDE